MPDFAPYEPDAAGPGAPLHSVIRKATADDLDGLASIQLAAVTRTREDWASVIDKSFADDRLLLLAEIDGQVGAFAQSHFLEEHPVDHGPAGFYLTGLTVVPAFRRAGLGRELTTQRLDWIGDRAGEAWYFASVGNESSIRLHREFGFAEVRRSPVIHGVSFGVGEGVLFRASI